MIKKIWDFLDGLHNDSWRVKIIEKNLDWVVLAFLYVIVDICQQCDESSAKQKVAILSEFSKLLIVVYHHFFHAELL
jgi:uncharacterized membrane protein YbjE (DUF340 family)